MVFSFFKRSKDESFRLLRRKALEKSGVFFSLFKKRKSYDGGKSIYSKHLKLQTITSQNQRKSFKQDDQMRNRVSYGVSQNFR